MKLKKLLVPLFVASLSFPTVGALQPAQVYAAGDVEINETNFPDPNFRNYVLENIDTSKDKKLSKSEIDGCDVIDCNNCNIASLEGIKFFSNLQYLGCWSNGLNGLDVSENTNLIFLDCSYNYLNNLDVSKNVNLKELNCGGNNLGSLDVSKNVNLKELDCAGNNLGSLDVSNNKNLKNLSCYENNIGSLNVKENTAMELLNCSANKLNSIDVSKNINLKYLLCDENNIDSLDVGKNKALESLHCSNNKLNSIDISKNTALDYLVCSSNNISELDISNNTALQTLICSDNKIGSLNVRKNTELECIWCDSNNLTSLDLSANLKMDTFHGFSQEKKISVVDGSIKLSDIDPDIVPQKVLYIDGATLVDDKFIDINGDYVFYHYDTGYQDNDYFGVTLKVIENIITVKGVTLDKTDVQVTEGDTLQLTASIDPSNSTDKKVEWSSSDKSIAEVDGSGKVTTKKPGTAKISVVTNDGEKTATCTVTVKKKEIPVTGVKLNKTTANVTEGDTLQLTATVSPTNATKKDVTWTSSNTAVATVDAKGKITAKKSGTAKISVKTKDGGKTAACTVTVKKKEIPVTGVKLNKTTANVTEGDTLQLTATVSPTTATNKELTWTSSNTAVATVDAKGKITAKKAGTAKITVKTKDGGKTATCTVTVKAKTVPKPTPKKNGWKYENGGWKYYKDDKAYTGWHLMGKSEGEKTTHWSYFGKDGKIYTGWHLMGKSEGEKTSHWSYFGPNGWLRTGWQQIGTKGNPDVNNKVHWSYFGENGWLRTGWQSMGKGTKNSYGENSAKHVSYFGVNGWLHTGWVRFGKGTNNPDGNSTPHFSYFGENGWLRTGWQHMGTKGNPDGKKEVHWSYFGENGWLRKGKQKIGSGNNKKTYSFDWRGWLYD